MAALLDQLVGWFEYLGPSVEKTVFLKMPGLDSLLTPLGESLGFELGMLKYVLAMFLAYPLAGILSLLPSTKLRHFFSLLVGLWYAQEIFGGQWIHSFISSLVTYLLVLVAPRKYVAILVFLFAMAYMSLSHLYRLYVDYLGWSLDFTGPQMILTIKLSSFAYNVYDGVVDAENISTPQENKLKARVFKDRLKHALYEVPGLLEFFGYVYCFTTFLAGPAFEYKEYASSMDGTAYTTKEMNGNSKRPSSILPSLSRLLQGVTYLALHLVGSAKYPVPGVYSKEILSLPFGERFLYALVALFFCRMKYYFAWKVAEGSCVLAGFGFEGYDESGGVIGWNGVSNMDVINFEIATNTAEASKTWNKGTQRWLQRYVYFRSGESLISTYFVSAFWHGFYPGYYLFFFSVAFVQTVQRYWQRKVSAYFTEGLAAKVYFLVCFLFFSAYINYYSIVFQVLAWDRAITVWSSYLWWGHVTTVVGFLLTLFLPTPPQKAVDASKKKAS